MVLPRDVQASPDLPRPKTATPNDENDSPKAPEPPLGNPTTPVSHKSRKSARQVFVKKKFYLDIKSKSVPKGQIHGLVSDLQALGGTIEDFFSKEVNTVISDAPDWKIRCPGPSPVVSPSTPGSLKNLSNISWSPATPTEERRKVPPSVVTPKSRVETILEKANLQAQGTCDVIETAHKLKITIWSLPKVLKWIDDFKQKLQPSQKPAHLKSHPTHHRSQSVDSYIAQQRELRPPYIKFETKCCAFKPVYQEYKRFPRLFLGGKFLISPFYPPEAHQNRFVHTRLDLERPIARSPARKRSPTKATPTKVTPKKRPPTPGGGKHVILSKKEPKPGYCELCNLEYPDLGPHLLSEGHTTLVQHGKLWLDVDRCMAKINRDNQDRDTPLTSAADF